MSLHAQRNAALIALSAVTLLTAANFYVKPSNHQHIALGMQTQLEDYNARAHPEHERSATIFDRTKLMDKAKDAKPWNKTYAEKERNLSGGS